MAETETLGILDEIQSIVADKLQVVSYKWLSRNFLVSSNTAKRLLEEFVEKYGDGMEVVFALSGWLKTDPSTYNIRLVSKYKLAEAKQEFDGHYSVQVYSIQACVPKDPATLWNDEFVQAESLFKQPPTVDNCLRDNRFCGVSNSFVKRNAAETPLAPSLLQAKTTTSGLSKSYSSHHSAAIPEPQQKKGQQSSLIRGLQPPDILKSDRSENHVNLHPEQPAQLLAAAKEKIPTSMIKDHSDKTYSGSGGSLATMWGRVSTKSKPDVPVAQSNTIQIAAVDQTCDAEATEYGQDGEDDLDLNIKRTSNGEGSRKRRVVLDFSDDEDGDVVSLASPDPEKNSLTDLKHISNSSGRDGNLIFENESKPNIKKDEAAVKSNEQMENKFSVKSKDKKAESPALEKPVVRGPGMDASTTDKVADAGLKRRKVLKTRIDERGREVTEVVWEGDEPDTKTSDSSVKKEENNVVNTSSTNRPPIARKSPAVVSSASANPSGKAGNKKAANKDPKQGNILSFFKKA